MTRLTRILLQVLSCRKAKETLQIGSVSQSIPSPKTSLKILLIKFYKDWQLFTVIMLFTVTLNPPISYSERRITLLYVTSDQLLSAPKEINIKFKGSHDGINVPRCCLDTENIDFKLIFGAWVAS